MIVTIAREKLYNRRPMGGGFAWSYLYTVTIPGEPYPFQGRRLAWARDLIKRKAPGARVVETWNEETP